MSYHNLVRCIRCDSINGDASHDAAFENAFTRRKVCRDCGSTDGFYDSVEKWVSTSTWWKFWTWRNGYWVKK